MNGKRLKKVVEKFWYWKLFGTFEKGLAHAWVND